MRRLQKIARPWFRWQTTLNLGVYEDDIEELLEAVSEELTDKESLELDEERIAEE
jgi:hypothetical protein